MGAGMGMALFDLHQTPTFLRLGDPDFLPAFLLHHLTSLLQLWPGHQRSAVYTCVFRHSGPWMETDNILTWL